MKKFFKRKGDYINEDEKFSATWKWGTFAVVFLVGFAFVNTFWFFSYVDKPSQPSVSPSFSENTVRIDQRAQSNEFIDTIDRPNNQFIEDRHPLSDSFVTE